MIKAGCNLLTYPRGKYSAALHRDCVVYIYIYEMISKTDEEESKCRLNRPLNSCVQNVQAARSMRETVYRISKYGNLVNLR